MLAMRRRRLFWAAPMPLWRWASWRRERWDGLPSHSPCWRRTNNNRSPTATCCELGEETMPGPLAGVKVIDLTAVLLGPFATQHLADMGADVIKVEPPDGDLLRVSGGSMGRDKGMGPIYMAANRNKRSLCLDLKKPAAVPVLKEMIRTADLFIHNSRPAAIERLGLGYQDLKKG